MEAKKELILFRVHYTDGYVDFWALSPDDARKAVKAELRSDQIITKVKKVKGEG